MSYNKLADEHLRIQAAPPGMQLVVVNRFNAGVVNIMRVPETVRRMGELGLEPRTSTPAEFALFLKAEVVKWAQVVKDSGVRID